MATTNRAAAMLHHEALPLKAVKTAFSALKKTCKDLHNQSLEPNANLTALLEAQVQAFDTFQANVSLAVDLERTGLQAVTA